LVLDANWTKKQASHHKESALTHALMLLHSYIKSSQHLQRVN